MRCVVIDRMPVYLMGFRVLLESSFPSWTISTAGSLKEGCRMIYEAPRDQLGIVILDRDLCTERDSEFVPRIRAMPNPQQIEIVLLGNAAQEHASLREMWGVNYFVDRQSSPDEIVQTVAAVGARTGTRNSPKSLPSSYQPLSNRQRELINLLRKGHSNKQIANALGLTCGTIKNYMVTLMRQFKVCSRLQLVAQLDELDLRADHRLPPRISVSASEPREGPARGSEAPRVW